MQTYEISLIVGFEETNLVGNVYYSNHIRWQGKCREMFLKDYAVTVLTEIQRGHIALVTLNCSCEYFKELFAFDEVIIRMGLLKIVQNRMTINFEYFRKENGGATLVARGQQEIACMRKVDGNLLAVDIPDQLRSSLKKFAN